MKPSIRREEKITILQTFHVGINADELGEIIAAGIDRLMPQLSARLHGQKLKLQLVDDEGDPLIDEGDDCIIRIEDRNDTLQEETL